MYTFSAVSLGEVLFSDFEPSKQCNLSEEDIQFTTNAVKQARPNEKEKNFLLDIFETVNVMDVNGKDLFGGDNVRAHKFALKLVKLKAMTEGRNNIYPTDILDFLDSLYMHRIDQNVARMDDDDIKYKFEDVKKEIQKIKRPTIR